MWQRWHSALRFLSRFVGRIPVKMSRGEHGTGQPHLHGLNEVGPGSGPTSVIAPDSGLRIVPPSIRQTAQPHLVRSPQRGHLPPARSNCTKLLSSRQFGGYSERSSGRIGITPLPEQPCRLRSQRVWHDAHHAPKSSVAFGAKQ